MAEGDHATHAVINVVAVETNKEHNDCRYRCPEDFQGQVALNRKSIAELVVSSPESNEAEDQQTDDANEKNGANCEQNLKEFVVNRCVCTRAGG